MIQLARKKSWTKTRLDLWEEHLQDPIVALAQALAMASRIVGAKILQKMWERPCWEGVWLSLDPWDVVRSHHSAIGMSWGNVGHTASISSSSSGRSRRLSRRRFKPFVSTETLKACALTGLHITAAEDEAGSSGSQSPDVGDMRRYGCPKSPHWTAMANDGPKVKASPRLSRAQCGTPRVECRATLVREGVPVPGGLGTCKGGLERPDCHLLCQEMHEAWLLAADHRGRAVTAEECGDEKLK